jgi:WD40 repeat protein
VPDTANCDRKVTVRVWRLADGAPVGDPLTGHADAVFAVAVGALPDGTPVIVSGSRDGIVRVWQLGDGTPLAHPLDLSGPVKGIALYDNLVVTAAGRDIAVHQLVAPWPVRKSSAFSGPGRAGTTIGKWPVIQYIRRRPPVIAREAARGRVRDSGTLSGTSGKEERRRGRTPDT